MIERIHARGRCTRDEILEAVRLEFGPRDQLERPLMNAFRFHHRGTIRWIPAGAYWQSNLPAAARTASAAGHAQPLAS
ncbi:hypothetical protein FJ658_07105 [Schumannella sp. 10F1B-5-1]|nr:hypothetical protein FJ658_07105 [Schumannella sp. 10F1B-5-1]